MKGLRIAVAAALIVSFVPPILASAAPPPTPTITISPSAAIVGSRVTVTGESYPPSAELTLEWSTVQAAWTVSGNPPRVTGLNATPTERSLTTAKTDALGSFTAEFVVPSDFGGKHVIQAYALNGTALTGRGIFTLEPSFKVSPSSGPAGTPINVTASGLGYGLYSTSYHLYWDNSYAGYMTAISSHGSTSFDIYASGSPGTHYVQVYQGYPGPGYLNPQQGPPSSETQSIFPPYIPFKAEFNVTGAQSPYSQAAPSLVVVGASLTSLGLVIFVARAGPGGRWKFARGAAVALIIIALLAGGAGGYLALAPPSNASGAFVPQATVVRPSISVPQNGAASGPRISVTPSIADVGQNVTVEGAGFAPGAQLPLSWATRKGSNLLGYQLVGEPLRNVAAGPDGAFAFTMLVPPDLGGIHYISASNLTGGSNGTLFIQRTAAISATEGPAGSVVAVTMTGVGWTFDTNIAALDYDNSYLGYGCGFNSGGNVTFYVVATGAPGVHTIDVYPSMWWGPSAPNDQLAVEYRYPLLTPQDHPELMPSFHFTFLITASGTQGQSGDAILPYAIASGMSAAGAVGVVSMLSRPQEVKEPKEARGK